MIANTAAFHWIRCACQSSKEIFSTRLKTNKYACMTVALEHFKLFSIKKGRL